MDLELLHRGLEKELCFASEIEFQSFGFSIFCDGLKGFFRWSVIIYLHSWIKLWRLRVDRYLLEIRNP